jgi:hypothetical protein
MNDVYQKLCLLVSVFALGFSLVALLSRASTGPGATVPVGLPIDASVSNLQSEIERQNAELERRGKQIDHLVGWVLASGSTKSIILDLSSKNFSRVDTGAGLFLVSCQDVVPYLDGYKLKLHIGNPLLMTANGLTVRARWGRPFPERGGGELTYDHWHSQLRTKDFELVETIQPGRWNAVELILSQTEAREIGYVEVSLETKLVSLAAPVPR